MISAYRSFIHVHNEQETRHELLRVRTETCLVGCALGRYSYYQVVDGRCGDVFLPTETTWRSALPTAVLLCVVCVVFVGCVRNTCIMSRNHGVKWCRVTALYFTIILPIISILYDPAALFVRLILSFRLRLTFLGLTAVYGIYTTTAAQ